MKRFILGMLSVILVAVLSFSSIQASSIDLKGRELSITLPSTTANDAFKTLISDFETATGVKVDLQIIPGGAPKAMPLIQAKIATKSYTDIIVYTSGASYLNPLNPADNMVEITNKDWLGKIKEGLLDIGGSYKGKAYGIPFGGIDFTGLLCNMNVFEQLSLTPPTTYDELVSVSQKILDSKKDIVPIYEMAKQGGPLSAYIYVDVAKKFYDDREVLTKLNTGKVRFEDTFILDSLIRKMDLQNKGFFNNKDMMSGTWDTLFRGISENKVAMSFVYSNVLPMLYKNYPSVNNVKLVPLNGVAVSTFTQALFIMKTKNQDVASAFIDYYLKDATLTKLYGSLKAVPAFININTEVDKSLLPMVEMFNQGKWAPVMFDLLVVNPGFVPLLQEMQSGTKTPQQVCSAASDKMKQLGKEMNLPGF